MSTAWCMGYMITTTENDTLVQTSSRLMTLMWRPSAVEMICGCYALFHWWHVCNVWPQDVLLRRQVIWVGWPTHYEPFKIVKSRAGADGFTNASPAGYILSHIYTCSLKNGVQHEQGDGTVSNCSEISIRSDLQTSRWMPDLPRK